MLNTKHGLGISLEGHECGSKLSSNNVGYVERSNLPPNSYGL